MKSDLVHATFVPRNRSRAATHSRARLYLSRKEQLGFGLLMVFGLMLFSLGAGTVQAQIDQTGFIPDPPVTGQPVLYRQTFLGCPPIPVENVEGESSWLLLEGNEVHLFVVFLPSPCPVPPPGPTVDFSFGFLPAGEHTLFQYRVPDTVTFPANPADFDPALERSFTVIQGGPSPVPGLTRWGIALLAIAIAGLAIWRFFPSRA